MPRQIRHLLARRRIVDRDDLRIPRRRQVLVRGTESDRADGLDEPAERMRHLARAVVEDVHTAVLVAGGGHFAVGGLGVL